MAILMILFNRQILKYLGTDALSIYGIIINISTFVQCCAYSIGQASQPIISVNFGANQGQRIKELLRYAIITAIVFGFIWTLLCFTIPNQFVSIFMNPTDHILLIAHQLYVVIVYLFYCYLSIYFQAILKPKTSFIVSIFRGMIISGILIMLLPSFFSAQSLWYAMPITELICLYVINRMIFYTKALNNC